MVILLTGASHTGKTFLAQKILEKYSYPYLSLDHLKMGLIRSGQTSLTPEDDDELTAYLWPIAAEMIKTVIENDQHLVVEGCYIPSDWQRHFDEKYLEHIKACCLIMSEEYISQNFSLIAKYANVIEHRINDDFDDMKKMLAENRQYLRLARKGHMNTLWIDKEYDSDLLLSNFHKIIYQGLEFHVFLFHIVLRHWHDIGISVQAKTSCHNFSHYPVADLGAGIPFLGHNHIFGAYGRHIHCPKSETFSCSTTKEIRIHKRKSEASGK